jgi:putative ABC transport system permease protein
VKTSDLFTSASQSLVQNRSRSLLTILGIVIGIAAVILMLSIGQGAQGLILNQVADLGSDQIFVESGSSDTGGGPPSPFTEQVLTLDDVEALRKKGDFNFVSGQLISTGTVGGGEESLITQVYGVDEYQLEVFPADVALGRYFDESDVDGYAKVAVLGSKLATDLFGESDPLGKKVTVKNTNVRVIGVLEEQGSRFFQNLDGNIYLPVTTAQRDVFGLDYVSYIAVRAKGDVDEAKEDARIILRDAHNIENPNGDLSKDDFSVSSQEDAVQIIGVVGSALTALLASIAAISLLVGGIGIMNIMLVSVTERTKEIGLRKAIGATEKEILRQFLLEAVLLTFFGGLLGIAIGISFSFLISLVLKNVIDGWTLIIPPSAIVVSAVVSTAVGLIFGYYPAKRAAKLDPIEALRYE